MEQHFAMKKLGLALAFFLWTSAAFAQCTGVFPANTLCGNLGASPAPPSAFSASGTVVGPGSSTLNGLPLWANTLGTQLKDGAGQTVAGNYTWSGTQIFNGTITLPSSTVGPTTLSGNNTFSGNNSFSGTDTFSAGLIGTGTAFPTQAAGQTVILGNVGPPSLTTNGQTALYNTAAAGAILQGAGSTNDISLINRSGTIVCSVGSGANALTCNNLSLGSPLPTSSGGTGVAGSLTGARKANGASADTQAATSDLSDVTTPTTWVPSDQSGASLTFTTVTALYTKIGKHIVAQFRLTYPSTASGSTATIGGLPVASSSSGAAFSAGTCVSTLASNFNFGVSMAANATTFTMNSATATLTNSNLSTITVTCTLSYISN